MKKFKVDSNNKEATFITPQQYGCLYTPEQ